MYQGTLNTCKEMKCSESLPSSGQGLACQVWGCGLEKKLGLAVPHSQQLFTSIISVCMVLVNDVQH